MATTTLPQTAVLSHPMHAAVVAKMAACAHRRLDATTASKIDHAAAIVLAGGVAPCSIFHPTQGYTVQSQSSPITTYDVIENVCNCADYEHNATHANEYTCKHILAVWLYRRVTVAMALLPPIAAYDRPPVPLCQTAMDADGLPCYAVHAVCPGHRTAVPLPEAAASVNVRLLVHGCEVQWTLRGTEEAALAERLEALLARYPQAARVPPVPPTPPKEDAPPARQPTPEGWCLRHGTQMTSHSNARGMWWSHKLDDGTYCKGKGQ